MCLHIPDCPQPWEQDAAFQYPSNLASPLDILLLASDGASDYGNKFGEPVINGFARTYGLRTPTSSAQQAPDDDNNNDDSKYWGSQRREYVKPIMFSSGMGQMEHTHATKGEPSVGLLVVKVGGPAYRIGMGGGAASSMMQGDNRDDLDFNAVQRGDAQMAQRVYRVLRACVELGPHNPIVSIHDQGAGGNCNVVKELIFPAGATIDVRSVVVGDASLSALEIWGAEYQEQFGLLLHPEREPLFNDMCRRENVTPAVLGTIDGSGRIRLWDSVEQRNVVDLDLKAVLGDLPRKTFVDRRLRLRPRPRQDAVGSSSTTLALPPGTSIVDMLHRVVALMTVGSKRFLTTKVDRSVTGLVAQQQCVGPLLLPLCGYAVTAQSHMALAGSATAIGECPSLTSVNPAAMARMAVAEMLTNLCGAAVTARVHIKCEANWMWAAKLPGDCASLLDAVASMRDVMISLGLAVDGGKDSLSMAARCPAGVTDEDDALQQDEEVVRAPGTLVVSGYCTMKDIRRKLTPDLKRAGGSSVVLVDIAQGRRRLAGSALAYVYGQLGGEYHDEGDNSSSDCPDVDNPTVLAAAFDHVQSLIAQQKPVRTGTSGVLAYHDVSVGGLLVALLEMAFAGNVGLNVAVHSQQLNSSSSNPGDTVATLFAEEVGMLLEVSDDALDSVLDGFRTCQVPCHIVATTRSDHVLHVKDNGVDVLLQADSSDGNTTSTTSSGENYSDIRYWRDKWEATSFALEMQQAAPQCVRAERDGLFSRTGPVYQVPWTPTPVTPCRLQQQKDVDSDVVPFRPCVAIVREEGSNGDREMSAAFHLAGFAVWDVAMRDIAAGHIKLSAFSGIAFVGGFSFGDVLDSAKGWAGVAQLSDVVRAELDAFFKREDTFSLGVCNGCQLMTLMSRVPSFLHEDSDAAAMENMRKKQPRFVRNKSGRYESRFSTVVVAHDSPAVMLKGMGGAKLGVWVAHGEGRAFFPDDAVKQAVLDQRLAPIRYVDDAGEVTKSYPHNPNGSDEGVAALCSRDGRHLAMMPHPERSVQLWQWPYATDEATRAGVSPWLTMFQNAYDWAVDAHVQQQQQQQQQ